MLGVRLTDNGGHESHGAMVAQSTQTFRLTHNVHGYTLITQKPRRGVSRPRHGQPLLGGITVYEYTSTMTSRTSRIASLPRRTSRRLWLLVALVVAALCCGFVLPGAIHRAATGAPAEASPARAMGILDARDDSSAFDAALAAGLHRHPPVPAQNPTFEQMNAGILRQAQKTK